MDTSTPSAGTPATPATAGTNINNQPPTGQPFTSTGSTASSSTSPTPTTNPFATAAANTPATPKTTTPFGVSSDTLNAAPKKGGIKLGGKSNPILIHVLVGVAALLVGAAITFFAMGGLSPKKTSSNNNGGSTTTPPPELTTVEHLRATLSLPDTTDTLVTIDATNLPTYINIPPQAAIGDEVYSFPATSPADAAFMAIYRPSTSLIVYFAQEYMNENPVGGGDGGDAGTTPTNPGTGDTGTTPTLPTTQ